MSIVEENGKALGKAVKDIGGAFCGSIVSIVGDIQTLGTDTMKIVKGEELRPGILVGCPDPECDPDTLVDCEECTEARAYHKTLLQPHQQGDLQ